MGQTMPATGMDGDFDKDLDVRGMNCPLPILKTKRELASMPAGQVLRVRATDPHAVIDFMAYCEKTGHPLLRHWTEGEEFHFLLQRKS